MRLTALIICGRAPRRSDPVPAIRYPDGWRCSWCGRLVKVVA